MQINTIFYIRQRLNLLLCTTLYGAAPQTNALPAIDSCIYWSI